MLKNKNGNQKARNLWSWPLQRWIWDGVSNRAKILQHDQKQASKWSNSAEANAPICSVSTLKPTPHIPLPNQYEQVPKLLGWAQRNCSRKRRTVPRGIYTYIYLSMHILMNAIMLMKNGASCGVTDNAGESEERDTPLYSKGGWHKRWLQRHPRCEWTRGRCSPQRGCKRGAGWTYVRMD